MLLSIKQYAVLFVLFIVLLVSAFAYQVSMKLDNTRQTIDTSQKRSSINELEHAIAITLDNIKQTAEQLSQWQEVKQQIENPEIYAYWHNVRFKKYAFDLQKYTTDLMIYDINGKALAILDDNTLPHFIDVGDISKISFRIINKLEIIAISPVFDTENNGTIIGYLGLRLQLLPLLKSHSAMRHVELDSLFLRPVEQSRFVSTLKADDFSYGLRRAEGIVLLESQMREAIIELLVIIIIPAVFLFVALVFIIVMPIKEIDNYINRLRINPDDINEESFSGFLQVKELNSVHDSLIKYHTELRQKEEHISLTLNSIGDAVITTDAENRIVRMNPVAEQLTGWSFDEAVGQQVKQVFNLRDGANKKAVEDPFEAVIDTGEIVHLSQDSILISKDGSEYNISDSAAPIRDNAGNIRGIVLVFNDITEQRMKDEQLQQSQKMDALGKLTGGIAHDFNNLLGVILGYSELLISMLDENSRSLRYAQQVHEAGERARKLTAKLLAFSRKDPPEAAVTDINQLIHSEQHLLAKTLTARVEIKLQLEDAIWPVLIDPGQLRDVILNICINAMHAMTEGGSLTISTENVNIDRFGKHHIDLDAGDYIQLAITDTGTGMDSNTRSKIFDPFFTTKGDKGTGLGMSQVYGFVQQSNGAIQVRSEPGSGTQVTLYLPRHQDLAEVPDEFQDVSTENGSIAAGSETILVVDDEPALLELSCNILNSHGYHTLQANDSTQAMDILEKQAVDLLLSDVIMPKVDGYQLAEMVSKKYPQVKIQMVSGFSEDRNLEASDNDLYKRQLKKPFTSAELLKRVRETLDS